jgi:hypothetical protein
VSTKKRLRHAERRFQIERDRRYAEVNVEKEKALKIKETADLAALQLAREIQTYKDEKANELREQINSERGLYVTKDELTSAIRELQALIKPLTDYMASDRGRNTSVITQRTQLMAGVSIVLVAIGIAVSVFIATR